MVLSVPLGQGVEEVANGTVPLHGIRHDILIDVLSWRLVVSNSMLLCLTDNGVQRLFSQNCPLFAVYGAIFGLAAHHISAKLKVLFQIGLYLEDQHLVSCHF